MKTENRFSVMEVENAKGPGVSAWIVFDASEGNRVQECKTREDAQKFADANAPGQLSRASAYRAHRNTVTAILQSEPEVEATPWFRTWFSIDPQPASISPTINISIVFISAFLRFNHKAP
jgi:hypothetical protein